MVRGSRVATEHTILTKMPRPGMVSPQWEPLAHHCSGSFDDAFVGDRHKLDNKEDVEAKEEADDEEAMVKATILVGRDAKS